MDSFDPSKSSSSSSSTPPPPPQLKDKHKKITSAEKKPFKRSVAKFDLNLPYPSKECVPWLNKKTIEENKGPNEAKNMNQHNIVSDQVMNQTITREKMLLHGGRKPPEDDWTQKEHELFLMGLIKYGKGNWKKISRKFVKTKSHKQVQAHAIEVFKNFPLPYSFPYTIKRPNLIINSQNVTPTTTTNPPTTSVVEPTMPPPPLSPTINVVEELEPEAMPPPALTRTTNMIDLEAAPAVPTPITDFIDLDSEVMPPPAAAPKPATIFIDLEAETMPSLDIELKPPVVLALAAAPRQTMMSLFPLEAPLFPIFPEDNSFAGPSFEEWTIGLPFSNYPSLLSGEPNLDLHLG